MKGHSHATMAAAVWLALEAPILGRHAPSPAALAVLTVVCAGAAMAPDMDHPSGSVAYSVPPFSKWLCQLIARVSGGHRHGTHSLVVLPLAWLAAWWAARAHPAAFGALRHEHWHPALLWGLPVLMLVFFLASFGLAAVRLTRSPWAVALAVTALAVWQFTPADWAMVPWCVATGWAVHIAGDMLTPQGVPVAWPASNWRFAIPLLGTVNFDRKISRENILTAVLSVGAVVLAGLSAVHYLQPVQAWAAAR